jgi:hypothetical protein
MVHQNGGRIIKPRKFFQTLVPVDDFQSAHMDVDIVAGVLLFRTETDSNIWLEEKQSLQANENHGKDRIGQSQAP